MQFRYSLRRDTPNRQWLLFDKKAGKAIEAYPYGQKKLAQRNLFVLDANENIADYAREYIIEADDLGG